MTRISGRTYEDMEKSLLYLAGLNDAPVLKLGEVWTAKSPLELFDLFAGRITQDEIDRFFSVARDILLTTDPALDLPDDQRWMAQVYGKSRLQSGILVKALCDSLQSCQFERPRFLHWPLLALAAELLCSCVKCSTTPMNAVAVAFLLLPALAEAAPNEFLSAIEASSEHDQRASGSPVYGDGLGDCKPVLVCGAALGARNPCLGTCADATSCPHSCCSCTTACEIHLGNSPRESLLGIFRSWLPQTAASLEQRIAALDLLITKEEGVAFDLLCGLVDHGLQHATPRDAPIGATMTLVPGTASQEAKYAG